MKIFVIGPPIGSYLYNIGGFMCPFWTIGCLILALSLALHFAVPDLPTTNVDNIGNNSDDNKISDIQKKFLKMFVVGRSNL